MKHRTITIPVMRGIPAAAMNLMMIGSAVGGWFFHYWPMNAYSDLLVPWTSYWSYRTLRYKGKPWTFTLGAPPPPGREPAAWPPKAGQCFICGVFDPDLMKVFGDDAHPACREWLGDWKPDGFLTGDEVRILVSGQPKAWVTVPYFEEGKPFTYVTVVEAVKKLEEDYQRAVGRADPRVVKGVIDDKVARPLAIPDFEYSRTCKCPICDNYFSGLRIWSGGHPRPCYCSGCTKLAESLGLNGPHHRNCYCHNCYLERDTNQ